MQSKSNIRSTLRQKRQLSFIKKVIYNFIFILFFISLAVLGLTTKEAQIKSVVVSGNSAVATENISKFAGTEMNVKYLWIIPTDNILLLRRKEIENDILNNIKQIGSVKIYTKGIDKINITVVERQANNLWCKGIPADSKSCYFMDSDGFIFEDAPQFSANTFPKYFGLILTDNPIGQYYIKNNFKNISALFNTLKRISFPPKYFVAITEHDFEIYLSYQGKILRNDERSFESQLVNLQALVDNGYIKTDTNSINKIKYIDLRFGNKVNFELNK